jgi:hypothetical protein
MAAQILVVKPKSLTAADKKLLREAGVVVVEAADPSQVRLIQPEGTALAGDELFYAAIKGIHLGGDSGTRRIFTETLVRLMDQHFADPKAESNDR